MVSHILDDVGGERLKCGSLVRDVLVVLRLVSHQKYALGHQVLELLSRHKVATLPYDARSLTGAHCHLAAYQPPVRRVSSARSRRQLLVANRFDQLATSEFRLLLPGTDSGGTKNKDR